MSRWCGQPLTEFYLLRDMDAETMRLELLQLGIADADSACERLVQLRGLTGAADALLRSATVAKRALRTLRI